LVQRVCYFKEKRKKEMDRIYTGFESIDKCLKICKGDLVVVGSRPAIGKTCFMGSMIERTIDKQKSLFFPMQLQKHKAIERLQPLNVEENNNFYLCEKFVDYEELLLIVAEHKIKYNVDVVFIDNAMDLYEYACCTENEMTIKLKELANKLNVAIILADGLRLLDNKYPCYIDLRHRTLIKYADKIITINRPDKTATEKEIEEGLVEFGVAEIRVDKDMDEYYSPSIKLKFDRENFTFDEISITP
jgi:replicative DNA helicase